MSQYLKTIKYYFPFICLTIFITYNTIHHIALYADGSAMLLTILDTKNFFIAQRERDFAYLLQQFIPVIAVNFGVKSIKLLSLFYSFNLAFASCIFWIGSLIYARVKKLNSIYWITTILMCFVLFNGGFLSCQEMLITPGLYWFIFLYFLSYNHDYDKKRGIKILICILCFFSLRLYQSSMFLAPLVLGVLLYNIKIKKSGWDFYQLTNLLFLFISSLFGAYSTVFPQDSSNARGFFDSLKMLPIEKIIVLLFAFMGLGLLCFIKNGAIFGVKNLIWYSGLLITALYTFIRGGTYFLNVRTLHFIQPLAFILISFILNKIFTLFLQSSIAAKKDVIECKKKYEIFGSIFLITSSIIMLFYGVYGFNEIANTSYISRALGLVAPFAFIIFVAVSYFINSDTESINNCPEKTFSYPAIICLVGMLFMMINSGIVFQTHLRTMANITQEEMGFIVAEEVISSPYYWAWVTPAQSILSQAIFTDSLNIQAIIISPPDQREDWYLADDISVYPNLSYYGLEYDFKIFQKDEVK